MLQVGDGGVVHCGPRGFSRIVSGRVVSPCIRVIRDELELMLQLLHGEGHLRPATATPQSRTVIKVTISAQSTSRELARTSNGNMVHRGSRGSSRIVPGRVISAFIRVIRDGMQLLLLPALRRGMARATPCHLLTPYAMRGGCDTARLARRPG